MINHNPIKATAEFRPRVLTPTGQILEAISAWAKIEMVEGMSQVPEPPISDEEAERLSDEAERIYAEQKAGWC
jgi:hypothetical protein